MVRRRQNEAMMKTKSLYHSHRFTTVVISIRACGHQTSPAPFTGTLADGALAVATGVVVTVSFAALRHGLHRGVQTARGAL
jgi:hypothetical protein